MMTSKAGRTVAAACLATTVLALTVACGSGTNAKSPASAGSSASTSVAADKAKADAANRALGAAGGAYDGTPFDAMLSAAQKKNIAEAVANARKARDILYAYDAKLRAIAVPASAQAAMNAVLEADRQQIADLDKFATVTAGTLELAWSQLFVDDSIGLSSSDALHGALGHPMPAVVTTDDKYYVAFAAWVFKQNTTAPQWRTAVAAGDLTQARSLTAEQRAAAQDFANIVAGLSFPANLTPKVTALKSALASYVSALNAEYALTSTAAMDASNQTDKDVTSVSQAAASLRSAIDSAAAAALPPVSSP